MKRIDISDNPITIVLRDLLLMEKLKEKKNNQVIQKRTKFKI